MHKNKRLLIAGLLLILGCGEAPPGGHAPDKARPVPAPVSAQSPALPGDDVLLARVNGTPITRYDLDQAIRSTFGESSTSRLDKTGRRKVLESLVAGRAISQARAAGLTPAERTALDRKVAAFREELLVKQYLTRYATPALVTRGMVEAYYEKHPDRFGGKTLRTYEMIMSTRRVTPGERDGLINALDEAAGQRGWGALAETLRDKGHPLAFRRGQVSEDPLHPQLKQLMASLETGEASHLSFIQGMAYLVKIVEEEEVPPRPLKEVSARIRKTLAPVQLKKAVKQASMQVLKTAEVVYYEEGSGLNDAR